MGASGNLGKRRAVEIGWKSGAFVMLGSGAGMGYALLNGKTGREDGNKGEDETKMEDGNKKEDRGARWTGAYSGTWAGGRG
jgi:hypothetical protein